MNPILQSCLQDHFGTADLSELGVNKNIKEFLEKLNVQMGHCASSESDQREKEALSQEKDRQAKLIKKLEEAHHQLLQSEKMASIGSLAAGVAHEINNPIGFVGSNLNTLREYVEDLLSVIDSYEAVWGSEKPPEIQKIAQEFDLGYLREDTLILLDECKDGISRVRRIVQDLKDFSHVDHGEWVITDLHKGIDSTLNIVNNEIKYKAKVTKNYGKLPEILCIGSQLNQVFLNLLVNSAQAIESDGEIQISTRCSNGWLSIEVTDNGCGMTAEQLKRIFDPFYTTKPVGQGTGLGLSLSYGIIKRHGGKIDVTSQVGEGTTFTIWLPEHPENAGEQVEENNQSEIDTGALN